MVAKRPALNVWKLLPARVRSVVGNNAIEGGNLSYTVTLAPSAVDTYAKVGVKEARGWDLKKRWYSPNVRFDAASNRLIIPKGVTTFTVYLSTRDDAFYEPNELVTLSVNGIEGTAYIRNDAEGIKIGRVSFVQEGEPLKFLVRMNPSKFVTYATIRWGEGASPGIDAKPPIFTNGVRYDVKTKLLVIPPATRQFGILFNSFRDGPDLPESVFVEVNGVRSVTGVFDSTKVLSVVASDAIEGGALTLRIAVASSKYTSVLLFSDIGGSVRAPDFSSLAIKGGDDPRGLPSRSPEYNGHYSQKECRARWRG